MQDYYWFLQVFLVWAFHSLISGKHYLIFHSKMAFPLFLIPIISFQMNICQHFDCWKNLISYRISDSLWIKHFGCFIISLSKFQFHDFSCMIQTHQETILPKFQVHCNYWVSHILKKACKTFLALQIHSLLFKLNYLED